MSFSALTQDLQKELKSNMPQIRFLLTKNPAIAYSTINEIATRVGKKYNMILSLNFPQRDKINDFESYGTENISMVIDKTKKTFPIKREIIKSKAAEIFGIVGLRWKFVYAMHDKRYCQNSSGRIRRKNRGNNSKAIKISL